MWGMTHLSIAHRFLGRGPMMSWLMTRDPLSHRGMTHWAMAHPRMHVLRERGWTTEHYLARLLPDIGRRDLAKLHLTGSRGCHRILGITGQVVLRRPRC